MNTRQRLGRRGLLKSMLAAGAAPWFVPSHVLGSGGRTSPSGKLTLGVIGVGAQGQGDMRNFLAQDAAPVTFVSEGTAGFEHGIRFIGESAWVHVKRGAIQASSADFLRDPQNKYDTMPITPEISKDHTRNFVDALRQGKRTICDIETAVRSDTLCHVALIAVKQGRRLRWDPGTERFLDDDAANAMLQPRPLRGEWRLPEIG